MKLIAPVRQPLLQMLVCNKHLIREIRAIWC
jgi:hypothetical protein